MRGTAIDLISRRVSVCCRDFKFKIFGLLQTREYFANTQSSLGMISDYFTLLLMSKINLTEVRTY
jgi:hypothetical protein